MKDLILTLKKPTTKSIKISGAKNSALAIIPATMFSTGTTYLSNVPEIYDVESILGILHDIGVSHNFMSGNLEIKSTNIPIKIDSSFVSKLRASYYFLGIGLALNKEIEIAMPGGCNIGDRNIEYHLELFRSFGAHVDQGKTMIKLKADNLIAVNHTFPFSSVGATINGIYVACHAKGVSTLSNCATEPEVVDLCKYLNSIGYSIKGVGTESLIIEGMLELPIEDNDFTIMPDRIEAATFLSLGIVSNGITISECNPDHMLRVIDTMVHIGSDVKVSHNEITLEPHSKLKGVEVEFDVYPNLPTDIQPILLAVLSIVEERSSLRDKIFNERNAFANELSLLGFDIEIAGSSFAVTGRRDITFSKITSHDLRCAAACIVLCLAHGKHGDTFRIVNGEQIFRGYSQLQEKLLAFGLEVVVE